MKPAFLSRTLHKWLGLLVGLQLVLWAISGFYMVVVDIDFIHGDSLVRNLSPALSAEDAKVSFSEVSSNHPQATQLSLRSLPGLSSPVYEVTTSSGKVLVDAGTGAQLSPLPADMVESLARSYYTGAGAVASTVLIGSDPPLEIQARPLPLWRVDFNDWLQTSFYIHPDTGVLVTRRHRFWRWFDFVWMFHIMDYDTRTDMNNSLLRVATALGAVAVLSGGWLLFFSFRRRRVQVTSRPVSS